jgi:hypothetical protein
MQLVLKVAVSVSKTDGTAAPKSEVLSSLIEELESGVTGMAFEADEGSYEIDSIDVTELVAEPTAR